MAVPALSKEICFKLSRSRNLVRPCNPHQSDRIWLCISALDSAVSNARDWKEIGIEDWNVLDVHNAVKEIAGEKPAKALKDENFSGRDLALILAENMSLLQRLVGDVASVKIKSNLMPILEKAEESRREGKKEARKKSITLLIKDENVCHEDEGSTTAKTERLLKATLHTDREFSDLFNSLGAFPLLYDKTTEVFSIITSLDKLKNNGHYLIDPSKSLAKKLMELDPTVQENEGSISNREKNCKCISFSL